MIPGSQPIRPDERLWRRIHKNHYVPIKPGSSEHKISSGAFTDHELSVDRAEIREAEGEDHSATRQDGAGVAQFLAALATELEQDLQPAPLPGNDAHANIVGAKPRATARRFARESAFLP